MGKQKVYRLRWRFEYSDGKADKWGIWNHDAEGSKQGASLTSKENLLFAHIEAEAIGVEAVPKKVVTCAGADLCNVNIVLAASFSADLKNQTRHFLGLQLVTRNEKVTAYVDGTTKVEMRTEDEKKINYVGYGR